MKHYYTGSKAEGLSLPGSDMDFMADINDRIGINAIRTPSESSEISNLNVHVCMEHTHPAFVLLRCINPLALFLNPFLQKCVQINNGKKYLSGNLIVQNFVTMPKWPGIVNFVDLTNKRQGPSIEMSFRFNVPSEGNDTVPSIHCEFWPNVATEWVQRSRRFGWPTENDITDIVNFGCHLVPIGHPHSNTQLMEWRLSFSMAERTLVWSFNHVQMQCYAVLKIFLKEFIKVKCSNENNVLCSYFIKTFLFWKYESTDLNFWCINKFGECLSFLLIEFYECLAEGMLRHYFIPEFNLLSVKLTDEAQNELLQLYGLIFERELDIVMEECRTLQPVWAKFLEADENQLRVIHNAKRNNFIKTDKVFLSFTWDLYKKGRNNNWRDLCKEHTSIDYSITKNLSKFPYWSLDDIIQKIISVQTKTCLKALLIKQLRCEKNFRAALESGEDIHSDTERMTLDLTMGKIWRAIALLMKQDYSSCLSIVNNIMSTIPPTALYSARVIGKFSRIGKAKCLYVDLFMNSILTTMERAKMAWVFDLVFSKGQIETLPLAIQIELHFCGGFTHPLVVSPFVCLYYVMFVCHHQLRQYDERDRALRRLVDIVNDPDQNGVHVFHSFNIAGHCLVIAGERHRAREMFNMSNSITALLGSGKHSAWWYLRHFCWELNSIKFKRNNYRIRYT